MVLKEVGAKARGARTLMAQTYSPKCFKVKLYLKQCGGGETKTEGVLQEREFAKGAQIKERVVASALA
jgi:hypothetical protein